MEILLITIGIPTIGVLMLLCRRELMETVDAERRSWCQTCLSVLAVLLILSATYITAQGLVALFSFGDELQAWILTGLRVCIIAVLVWTSMAALLISREPFHAEPSVVQMAIQARRRQTLLLGCLAITALPIGIFGAGPLFIFWIGRYLKFSLLEFLLRARESRLLWTLSIASRFHRPFDQEVIRLSQTESGKHQRRLETLAGALEDGSSLSLALQAVPDLLQSEYVSAIYAGEQSGELDQVLQALATRQSSKVNNWFGHEMQSNFLVMNSLIGLSVLLLLWSFLCTFIIPKFKAIFNDFGVELPASTVQLISMTDFFVNYWYLFALFTLPIVCTFFLLVMLGLGYQGRYVSLLKGIWPRLQAPGILRTLSIAVGARANPQLVLDNFADGADSSATRSRFERLSIRYARGNSLATALKEEHVISDQEAHAIDVAESRGHLAWALNSISEKIELNRSNRMHVVIESCKPVFVIGLGIVVGAFCLALLSPLIKLLEDLS